MFSRLAALLLGLLLLASCGGGGGGGDDGGGNSLRFSADRSQVTLAYDEGAGFMPTANVTVTATGEYSGTLYVGAVVEGNGIDPNLPAVISGTQASFTLRARSGLLVGTYSGRVRLMACQDSACARQIGNSPVIVNYEVTVRATLKANPTTVTASAQSGSTTSSTVAIQLPTGASTLAATVTQGSQWMFIDQQTASGFQVNLRSLPAGNYSGSIQVTAGASHVNIPVNYTVAEGVPRTEMTVSPTSLALSGTEGSVNAPVALTVTPPSWDPSTSVRFTMPYAEEAVSWLSSTSVTGGHDIVVDATDLTAGTYTAWARVSGAWPTQEIAVPIALTVGPGLVRPADVLEDIESDTTAADLAGTVPIDVAAGPVTNWSATSDASWLVLTDASGATGETLGYRIDEAQLATLGNGTQHTAHVTVTPQRTTMTPVTFEVHLSKRLAAVTSVGPYLQPAQRDVRVILRGFGFDGIADLGARLQFTGGTVTQVTRVNDTELVVEIGPLPQGSWPFSFTNVLNQPAASASLRTYMPQTFAEAVVPTNGAIRGLFYDAERSSVYAVNVGLESLQQIRFDGAQWQLTSLAVPAILSAGLTQDGTRLLVASSGPGVSRIRQQDAQDMSTQLASTDLSQQIYRGFTNIDGVIHSTNDGRSWLTVGTTWNDMAYFDAASEQLTIVRPEVPTSFYSGPWYTASRDGERLIVIQSGSISSDPPALYRDAADDEVRINPAGLTFTYRMSLSDDGSRFAYDNHIVRDQDFALVGNIPTLTGNYFVVSSVLSPDGSRLYGVAYPPNVGGGAARVYVFDTSSRPANGELPVLGHYDLSDYPSCFDSSGSCNSVVHMAITPDGANLFVAGDLRLLVVPAEGATLTPMSSSGGMRKPGAGATTPWHLELTREKH